ncbi:hypothetical protein WDW86_11815 [Bdellovibrionota bacterium FG-2]
MKKLYWLPLVGAFLISPVLGFAGDAPKTTSVDTKLGVGASGQGVLGVEKTGNDGKTTATGSIMVEGLDQARFRLQLEDNKVPVLKEYTARNAMAYYVPTSADLQAVVGDKGRGHAIATLYKVGFEATGEPSYPLKVKLKAEIGPYVGIGAHGKAAALGAGLEINTEVGLGLQLDSATRLDGTLGRKTRAQIAGVNELVSDEMLKELRLTRDNGAGQKRYIALQSISQLSDAVKPGSYDSPESNKFSGLVVGGAF